MWVDHTNELVKTGGVGKWGEEETADFWVAYARDMAKEAARCVAFAEPHMTHSDGIVTMETKYGLVFFMV